MDATARLGARKVNPVQTWLGRDTETAGPGGAPRAASSVPTLASLLGRTVRISGKICCHQDLYIDGEVDGQMELTDYKLTIGPQARVKANVRAQNVVIVGQAEGNIQATERVELCSECHLEGDIQTPRIVIKDGAHFKGTIHTMRPDLPEGAPERPAATE